MPSVQIAARTVPLSQIHVAPLRRHLHLAPQRSPLPHCWRDEERPRGRDSRRLDRKVARSRQSAEIRGWLESAKAESCAQEPLGGVHSTAAFFGSIGHRQHVVDLVLRVEKTVCQAALGLDLLPSRRKVEQVSRRDIVPGALRIVSFYAGSARLVVAQGAVHPGERRRGCSSVGFPSWVEACWSRCRRSSPHRSCGGPEADDIVERSWRGQFENQ